MQYFLSSFRKIILKEFFYPFVHSHRIFASKVIHYNIHEVITMDENRYKQQDELFRLRIARLCTDHNMGLKDLSYAVDKSSSYISNIMTGKKHPSMHGLYDICDCFSMSPSQFFSYEDVGIKTAAYLDKVLNTTEQQRKMILDFIDMLNKNECK